MKFMSITARQKMRSYFFSLTLALSANCLADSVVDVVPLGLSITGRINAHNDVTNQVYYLNSSELLSLPQHKLVTATPWTPVAEFKGPLLEDVLQRVKATGRYLDIVAYDGYVARDIPITDLTRFHPVLAYMKDGVFLKLRNLGPLFLVYPLDSNQRSLRTSDYSMREIRQIRSITIK